MAMMWSTQIPKGGLAKAMQFLGLDASPEWQTKEIRDVNSWK
jgi:hypothetical protein